MTCLWFPSWLIAPGTALKEIYKGLQAGLQTRLACLFIEGQGQQWYGVIAGQPG
jgi:hypothetical protein